MIQFIDAAISRKRTTLLMMAVIVLCGLIARAIAADRQRPAHRPALFLHRHTARGHFTRGRGASAGAADGDRAAQDRGHRGNHRARLGRPRNAVRGIRRQDYDLDAALIDVREAVDRGKSEIPATAEEPIVRELDVDDFPLIQINLLSNGASERQVYQPRHWTCATISRRSPRSSAQICRVIAKRYWKYSSIRRLWKPTRISSEALVSVLHATTA
jgi:multidrug efflux pump